MEETLKLILEKISNMDNKMQEMHQDISGMKQEVTGLKQEVTGLKQDVTGLKQDVAELKQDVNGLKQDVIRIENKMDDKFSALFDGHTQNTEAIQQLNEKINHLVEIQERQDVEIKVIHTKVN